MITPLDHYNKLLADAIEENEFLKDVIVRNPNGPTVVGAISKENFDEGVKLSNAKVKAIKKVVAAINGFYGASDELEFFLEDKR